MKLRSCTVLMNASRFGLVFFVLVFLGFIGFVFVFYLMIKINVFIINAVLVSVVYVSEDCSALQLLPVLTWSLSCTILYQKRKQFWFLLRWGFVTITYMCFSVALVMCCSKAHVRELKKLQDHTGRWTLFPSQGLSWLFRKHRKIFGAMMWTPCPTAWTGALFTG